MIVYPEENYNSWISEDDADEYFETRLNASEWDTANKEVSLQTAFRSLAELSFNIYFDDSNIIDSDIYSDSEAANILKDLQQAQCEQVLYELKNDLDDKSTVSAINLGGLFSAKFNKKDQQAPQRFSERTLSILRHLIQARTVTRTR